ncbi:MAG TPA: carbohydrate-binding protein, partial [Opitutaceae bacterium]|nr:carbohydrate-binding protein [Opitutaceae bacterium]
MAASIPSASRRFLTSSFLSLPARPVFFKKWTSLLPFLAISAALLSLPAKAALPSRVFAPYIQMNTQSLTSVSQASGIKYFTLAFIIDNGSGQGTWEAGSSVASDTSIAPSIAALRSAGGDVIISFGGAAGNELAIGITNVSTLQSVYQGIINKYGVTALDFDIEGSALDNTSANDRRNQALAGLQSANPGLFVSYTLPVTPTGLLSNSIALLQNAKSHGVNVACVNIMAMDYGSSTSPSMGQDAISASNDTISQLSSNGLTTNLGITVLIGNQDTSPEVFTLNDAQTTENYAVGQSQVNRVAFWEVARDQCGSSCSGVSQSPWQFSQIFEPFSGGGTTSEGPFGGTPAAIPGTVQAENYDTGGQGVAYNIGSINGTDNGYRSDGVDLEVTSDTGGGVDLGWTFGGDWFKYTVNVATAGTYTVSFRIAA